MSSKKYVCFENFSGRLSCPVNPFIWVLRKKPLKHTTYWFYATLNNHLPPKSCASVSRGPKFNHCSKTKSSRSVWYGGRAQLQRGLRQNWLPFVNKFRTLCTRPPPEIKVALRGFTEANFLFWNVITGGCNKAYTRNRTATFSLGFSIESEVSLFRGKSLVDVFIMKPLCHSSVISTSFERSTFELQNLATRLHGSPPPLFWLFAAPLHFTS